MSARRMHCASALSTLAVLLATLGGPYAHAGVFDDDEARRQIKDLSIQTNERVDTLSKAQFELINQIQALREENAKLRGQVETLGYELESTKKRQQDFYIDLDGRLRKFEPQVASTDDTRPGDEAKAAPEAAKKSADPAAESRDYETALNFFKGNKIKEAAGAFESFGKKYPDSSMAPNAQYWLGNAYYALRECKKSVDAHKLVVSKWPQHAKAPDSLINIATCLQELGDAKGAKATLEAVLAKYPGSSAAATAKQRLKK
jgi:tol-pal system protein YbgF